MALEDVRVPGAVCSPSTPLPMRDLHPASPWALQFSVGAELLSNSVLPGQPSPERSPVWAMEPVSGPVEVDRAAGRAFTVTADLGRLWLNQGEERQLVSGESGKSLLGGSCKTSTGGETQLRENREDPCLRSGQWEQSPIDLGGLQCWRPGRPRGSTGRSAADGGLRPYGGCPLTCVLRFRMRRESLCGPCFKEHSLS